MPLPRRAMAGSCFDRVEVNIYDTHTPNKEIIFTGTYLQAANFLHIHRSHLQYALQQKSLIKKRYAVRIKKQINMENLTSEYFEELSKKYPEAVKHFFDWIIAYKESINWDELFGGHLSFFELPYDMQNGIIARFDLEKFYGKNGYLKVKRAEPERYKKLFADVEDAIKNRSIKYN